MKTSNKILLTTGAIPFLCVFILALLLKMLPLEAKIPDATQVDKSLWITKTVPMKDFDNISSKGLWEIHLVQADDYLVEIKAPEDIMEMISVKNVDQALSLDNSHVPRQSQNNPKLEVLIRLPSLSEINMQGTSDFYFQELTTDSLSIHADGLIKLSGTDSTIENLSFICNGYSMIDLSETKVTNANVQCNGIFKMDLLMNGGNLKGKLNGMGTLYLQGSVMSGGFTRYTPFIKIVSAVKPLGRSKPPEPPEPPLFQ